MFGGRPAAPIVGRHPAPQHLDSSIEAGGCPLARRNKLEAPGRLGRAVGGLLIAALLALGARPAEAQVPQHVAHIACWKPQSPAAQRAMRALCRAFHNALPNVRPSVLLNPVEDAFRLLHYWIKDETWKPEVALVSEMWLPELGDGLRPLPDNIAQRVSDRCPAAVVERLRVGDKLVAVPWWGEARVLFYWPRYIDKRRWRPQSWDEVVDLCAGAARKHKVWGLGIPSRGLAAARLFMEMLWSVDGSLRNAQGEIDFTGPAVEHVLALLVRADRIRASQPQMLTWTQPELEEAFVERKLAAIVASTALEEDLGDASKRRWDAAPLPAKHPFTSLILDCFASLSGLQQTEATDMFLALAASPQGQAMVAEAGGISICPELTRRTARTPATKAAAACGEFRFFPRDSWRALVTALDHAIYLAVSGRRSTFRALEAAEAVYREASQAGR